MTIKWPKEWAEDEGWPVVGRQGEAPACDSRLWVSLGNRLKEKHGCTLQDRAEALGGPAARHLNHTRWTQDRVDGEILRFSKQNQARPTASIPVFATIDKWLRASGSSLSNRCDELGLPTLLNRSRTQEEVDAAILSFAEANGRRPTVLSSKEFQLIQAWLTNRGSSLSRRCDELGLPDERARFSEDSVKELVHAFFTSHGVRPMARSTQAIVKATSWLRRQTPPRTLDSLCTSMGLPPRPRTCKGPQQKWALESADAAVSSFFREHGRRPCAADLQTVDKWLRRNGSSVGARADVLGLPGRRKSAASKVKS